MIKITRWTSDICGCSTCYTWDDAVPLSERTTKDVAYTPCAIHDPVNAGKTLIADDISAAVEDRIRDTAKRFTKVVSAAARRPKQARGNIPMAETAAIRTEMYLKEDAKSILINMPEFGRDGERGREFVVEPVVTFDAVRKLTIELPGVSSVDRAKAADAIAAAATSDSRLALNVSVRR